MGENDDHDEIIRLGVVVDNQGKDIDGLKKDKRAGVIAILGLVAKTVFDHFTKGTP